MTLRDTIDGLVLGGAQPTREGGLVLRSRQERWLSDRHVALTLLGHEAVVVDRKLEVAPCEMIRRWDGPSVPVDLELNAYVLAHWHSGRGQVTNKGFAVRLTMHRFAQAAVQGLADRLRERYGWEAEVFWNNKAYALRLARSGDRMGLRRLVAPFMLPCFASKLAIVESKPTTAAEGTRRRKPHVLTEDGVRILRAAAEAGIPYATIAGELGVSERHVGKIARGERSKYPDVLPVRRYRTRH